ASGINQIVCSLSGIAGGVTGEEDSVSRISGKEQDHETGQHPNQPARNGEPPSVLWDSRKRIAASVSWVHWSCEFLRKRGAISEIRKSLPVRGPRWRRPYCTMIVPVIMG